MHKIANINIDGWFSHQLCLKRKILK